MTRIVAATCLAAILIIALLFIARISPSARLTETVVGRESPCDIFLAGKTPCVAAHSTVRALYGNYDGKLYQVMRASDKAVTDIPTLTAGGFANSAVQDEFCIETKCTINRIYDQSPQGNHLDTAPPGGAHRIADTGVNATAEKLMVGDHPVYAARFQPGNGYRNDKTSGIAKGDDAETMYMVTSGKYYNDRCCFDYGNAETDNNDDGAGTMEAIYFGNAKGGLNHGGAGNGPWIMADLENALWGADVITSNEDPIIHEFVTAMIKGDASTTSSHAYIESVDYSGNDIAPCGYDGCVLPKSSTRLDCESKCNATSTCVGYVFADASCSGRSGPICWTKGSMRESRQKACRNSRVLRHPFEVGVDYGGNDIAPCGFDGCILPKSSTHLDCERTCGAVSGCVGYVFADASCSGQSGPICWTKGAMGQPLQKSCRSSRVMKEILGHWAIKGGDAQSGRLKVYWDGKRAPGYAPMKKQGAIILGIGGDNSAGAVGVFYEGVMTQGYSSDATDDAVQANIVGAGYKAISESRLVSIM